MKASEFIKLLQDKCGEDDPIIEFYSYEWMDDLESLEYQKRYFEDACRNNGVIRIKISR